MKALPFILVAAAVIVTSAHAQTKNNMNHEPRKIEVTGYAEKEVMPDELYFTISLREYFKDEKNQNEKVLISTLEKQLVQAVATAGLPKDDLSVSGVGGYQQQWDKNKKPAVFLESKQYELKIDRADKLDGILSRVDSRGVQYASMSRSDYSRREEIKNQVKVEALKNAKEKAAFLLTSIGEEAGSVLEIRELEEGAFYPQPLYKSNMRMMAADASEGTPDSNLDYQKIKLSYRMQAVFKIKD